MKNRPRRWSRIAVGAALSMTAIAVTGLLAGVPPAPAADSTATVAVAVSGDDVEELATGWFDTTSSDLELVDEKVPQTVGIRFTGLPVPTGAVITGAWIQFSVDETGSAPATLVVAAEASGSAPPYTTSARPSSRPLTTATVTWQPPPWTRVGDAGVDQRTPDLATVIQEVVSRPDWAPGNPIGFVLTGTGTRTADSFEGGNPPQLIVTWSSATTTTTVPTTTTTTVPTTTTTTTTTVPTTTTIPSGTVRFAVIGDWGGVPARQQAVRDMIDSWAADVVVTVGDNIYWDGGYDKVVGTYYHAYIAGYQGEFGTGSPINRFFPALGNHDYTDGGLAEYLAFFDLPGAGVTTNSPSGNERYYDARIGPAHFFVLNSNLQEPDGLAPDTTQGLWLQSALASSDAQWKVVVFHHPPYSSIPGKTTTRMRWPFAAWGADLVLSGDAHVYERLEANGLTYVVSGLGVNNTAFDGPTILESQAFWSEDAPGALFVTACETSLHMEFRPVGYGVVDSHTLGSGSCDP